MSALEPQWSRSDVNLVFFNQCMLFNKKIYNVANIQLHSHLLFISQHPVVRHLNKRGENIATSCRPQQAARLSY